MKTMLLSLALLLLFIGTAKADGQQHAKSFDLPACDERPPREPRVTCVKKCDIRRGDGDCISYGDDYCGPRAQCVPACNIRKGNGECISYAEDHCAPNAQCVPDCDIRRGNGECISYGRDRCN